MFFLFLLGKKFRFCCCFQALGLTSVLAFSRIFLCQRLRRRKKCKACLNFSLIWLTLCGNFFLGMSLRKLVNFKLLNPRSKFFRMAIRLLFSLQHKHIEDVHMQDEYLVDLKCSKKSGLEKFCWFLQTWQRIQKLYLYTLRK